MRYRVIVRPLTDALYTKFTQISALGAGMAALTGHGGKKYAHDWWGWQGCEADLQALFGQHAGKYGMCGARGDAHGDGCWSQGKSRGFGALEGGCAQSLGAGGEALPTEAAQQQPHHNRGCCDNATHLKVLPQGSDGACDDGCGGGHCPNSAAPTLLHSLELKPTIDRWCSGCAARPCGEERSSATCAVAYHLSVTITLSRLLIGHDH